MSGYFAQDRMQFAVPRVTFAVQRLILLQVAVFVVQLLVGPIAVLIGAGSLQLFPPGGPMMDWLGFQPMAVLTGAVWQPFTYIFLHSGLLHLFMNGLWLFGFGPHVERAIGTRNFFLFYIACGALGVLAAYVPFLLRGDNAPIIGASGAVMGVLIAFATIDPDREFHLFPLPMPINARGIVLIVIVINILNTFSNNNVSVATHFGGMIAGYALYKTLPIWRNWRLPLPSVPSRRLVRPKRKPGAPKSGMDKVGEAVDNIFKFEDRSGRR